MSTSNRLFISGIVLTCIGTMVAIFGAPKMGVTISSTGVVLMFAGFSRRAGGSQ